MKRSPMKRGTSTLKRTSMKRGRKTVAKKGSKKKKKLTDGKLKKLVWVQFSIFIRTRGADSDGFNVCVTCSLRLHWKLLQAGHFIRGRLNANLFDERGCWAQCYRCNIHRQGHVVVYYKWMLANYGQEVIDELIQQNNQTKKWAANELADLLAHYQTINAANPLTQATVSEH